MVTIDPGSQNHPQGRAFVVNQPQNLRFAALNNADKEKRIEANLKSSRILSDAQTQGMFFESFAD